MAIGMTYDQYWYGDVHMARAFYEEHKIKKKIMDEYAWLFGAYTRLAILSTIGNAFRGKSRPIEYPKTPFSSEDKEFVDEEKREEQEEVWALAYMTNMVMAGKNWATKK